jgi:hypothetical protein
MQALIRDMDKNKKLLDFRLIDGTEDLEYFNENGYTNKQEVEQDCSGDWYVKGYIPEPSKKELARQEIQQLKQYLIQTDYVVIKIAEGEEPTAHTLEVISERKRARARINELEEQLED